MSAPVPTIASGALRKILATLTAFDVDPAPICAELGIERSAVDDPDARFPLATYYDLWEAVLRTLPRPGSALLMAQANAPGDYGLMGFVVMNSATVREALGSFARFAGLWTDAAEIRLDEDGTLRVIHRAGFADRLGLRVATEAAPAEILHGARLLTQTNVTPLEVRFAHRAPSDTSVHESFFQCPVRFGQRDTAMVLRREDLALGLPKADAQLGAFLRGMANEALKRRAGAAPRSHERIREIVAEELQKGVPSLEQVAKRMATSERTLRRRLEESGTSFRNLLDETRAELARSYVRDRHLPLTEVAFLLGFSEPSAFHRAFKRWTDTTPSAWRQRTE